VCQKSINLSFPSQDGKHLDVTRLNHSKNFVKPLDKTKEIWYNIITKEREVHTMTQTYTMILRSCESRPSMEVKLPEVSRDRIEKAISKAIMAFRSVEVFADETGEIIFSYYMDFDFFSPIYNHGEMVDILCHICYDENY
jgi:predicted Holliday junction resolvase-like endonuclease